MATYSIATAALAFGLDRKYLENLLARYPGLPRASAKQGRAQKLSRQFLLKLSATLALHREFGVPLTAAAAVIERLTDIGQTPSALALGAVQVSIDFPALERSLDAQLAEALEIAPRIRRGRPPRNAARISGAG